MDHWKLPQPKKIILSSHAANCSLITLTAAPSLDYSFNDTVADFTDIRKPRVGRMCSCVLDEPREVGMSKKRPGGIEDNGRSMIPGPLRLDQIAEFVELEIGRYDASNLSSQRCAQGDHRGADAERIIR